MVANIITAERASVVAGFVPATSRTDPIVPAVGDATQAHHSGHRFILGGLIPRASRPGSGAALLIVLVQIDAAFLPAET